MSEQDRTAGRFLGGLLRVLTLGFLRRKVEGGKAATAGVATETTKTPMRIVKVIAICFLGVTLTAASCRDFRDGFIEGALGVTPTPTPTPSWMPPGAVFIPPPARPPGRICGLSDCNCWHDPADGCDYCWLFIPPSSCPGATTPVPTATLPPTTVPTSTPSGPGPGIPTATVTPTPTPPPTSSCEAASACLGVAPVSIIGPRLPGFQLFAGPNGGVFRAARPSCSTCLSGDGAYTWQARSASERISEWLAMAPGNYWECGGVVYAQNLNVGAMDACGRMYDSPHRECPIGPLYAVAKPQPEGWTASYSFNLVSLPVTTCPTPTPSAPAPPTGVVSPPTLVRQKVQNIDRTSSREPGKFGCHNPIDSPKFVDHNLCEVGSTPLYRGNVKTGFVDVPAGPCDRDHPAQWMTFCGQREWNAPPEWFIEGAVGHISGENPHHFIVRFEPGRCFKITTCARMVSETDDGISVPVSGNTCTTAEHCY